MNEKLLIHINHFNFLCLEQSFFNLNGVALWMFYKANAIACNFKLKPLMNKALIDYGVKDAFDKAKLEDESYGMYSDNV